MPTSLRASATSEPDRPGIGWGLALVGLSLLVFGAALQADYVLDGVLVVRDNPLLSPFDPVRIAGLDWWEGSGRPGGLHRPVSLVALAGLRALSQGPGAINLANVLLLGAVAWLRFELLRRLLGSRPWAVPVAWSAAAIALVHPLNAELACGQVGIADLLAGAFGTGALLVATRGAGLGRTLAAATLAALAVLSKEAGTLVVPFAVLFELLRDEQPRPRFARVARALAWSGAGVTAALACRLMAIGSLASVDDPVYAGFSTLARIASSCATLAGYSLPLLLLPWRQLAVVGHQDVAPADGFGDARAVLGAAALLALVALAWIAARKGRRPLAFGISAFLVAWLPTSNLLVSMGALAASRFLFHGLFAAALPLAILMHVLWARGGVARAAALALAAWFGPVMALCAAREVTTWESPRRLLEAQAERAPDSAYELVDLANELRSSDPRRALALFERAVATREVVIPETTTPPEDLLESFALARMGAAELAEGLGDVERALREYRAAAELAQRGIDARATLPFREDWTRQREVALQRAAGLELARARDLAGEQRESALERAGRDLDAVSDGGASSPETVRLRALWFDRKGDAAGRARCIEEAWTANPDEPLLRILWASELRQRQRTGEALEIELGVVEQQFDAFDRSRALGVAVEAANSASSAHSARGRALLERLARPEARAPRGDEISARAAQALGSLPRRP